ncbi:MAG: hypothetical protein ACRD4I_09995, partial [Candidatus Angelobacter sp.]
VFDNLARTSILTNQFSATGGLNGCELRKIFAQVNQAKAEGFLEFQFSERKILCFNEHRYGSRKYVTRHNGLGNTADGQT